MAYFTIADLRARYDELTEEDYPDPVVQDGIDLAVQAYEDAAGLAFEPRAATEVITELVDAVTIRLPHRHVRSITSADGADTGTIDITGARIKRRLVTLPTAWPAGEDITVEYQHGLDAPRLRTIQAVQILARTWIINGPIDTRATQLPAADGGVINLSTPGMFGAEFGIPEVDQALERDRDKAYVI